MLSSQIFGLKKDPFCGLTYAIYPVESASNCLKLPPIGDGIAIMQDEQRVLDGVCEGRWAACRQRCEKLVNPTGCRFIAIASSGGLVVAGEACRDDTGQVCE